MQRKRQKLSSNKDESEPKPKKKEKKKKKITGDEIEDVARVLRDKPMSPFDLFKENNKDKSSKYICKNPTFLLISELNHLAFL